MRQINEAFAARLAADETSLCACWRLTRADGAVFGATDHDRAIVFDGVAYEPACGLKGATFESSAGLAPGRCAAEGAISADFIEEADLEAGLWDRAKVDVWRVDWKAPEHRVRIWSGRLSEITRHGASFVAELVSLKADLERPVGRVYARGCDAEVGDVRCGFDLSLPEFRGEGAVVIPVGDKSFTVGGLGGFADGWFVRGAISWTSGANAGTAGRVVRHSGNEIELSAAPRFAMAPGDAFVVTAGCDKSFVTCGTKFANRDNFRGFPHMPGPDAVLAGPSSTNSGGSRL
ncbi:MAG TPA: DUF2163 domain-containing protein [Hyphomonadaceae bacterium]|jgi:uncharacterized phage protein (TIGR02218 family)|nr:DUF2163 domain-containing protein [Hyphomonadaceae bacterium]